jgi:predicted transport protein
MSDLKLFSTKQKNIVELASFEAKLEKTLQKLFEDNLEELLGVRFIQSEYRTSNGGRIDTIGIDENNCPVIIEYKKSSNENIINQGLFYLDWLLDHKADFEVIVHKSEHKVHLDEVEWSAPRLICVASDFSKYDQYAVNQINRNIDLLRYKFFDGDFLLLEQLTQVSQSNSDLAETKKIKTLKTKSTKSSQRTFNIHVAQLSENLSNVLSELDDFVRSLDSKIAYKELKFYAAYSLVRNFVCVEAISTQDKLLVYLKLHEEQFLNSKIKCRDVSKIGHYGTGNTEFTIKTLEEVEQLKPYIKLSLGNI